MPPDIGVDESCLRTQMPMIPALDVDAEESCLQTLRLMSPASKV